VSGIYLLDTGVALRAARHDPFVQRRLVQAQAVQVPDIVLGELYFGAYKYARLHQSTKFLDICDAFLQRYEKQIVHCDGETARVYGAIYAQSEATGQLIQQNDVWIAALARQHRLILATGDTDFKRVQGVNIEIW
jgi:tRNA(fMet)-specific endonuclease VapC